jgi:uncharacterized protein (TIGR02594 family)
MLKYLLIAAISLGIAVTAAQPSAEAAPRKHATKKQKLPVEQCWFLAWEVPCAAPETANAAPTSASTRAGLSTANGNKNIQTAKRYEGLNARRDRQQIAQIISQPFARNIDPAQTPWCAAFANHVLHRNGYNGTNSLLARSFLNYGVSTRDPQPGDIVVIRRGHSGRSGHVGFYVDTVTMNGARYVRVFGGNQQKSVQVSHYPVHQVLGYRQPVDG